MTARLAVLFALLLTACPSAPGGDPEPTPAPEPDPFADYEHDPSIVVGAVDATLQLNENEVAADQLIVILEEGGAIEPVLDALQATQIGVIPRLDAYQLALPAGSDLETAWSTATALAGVTGATWNVIHTYEESPYCLVENDNYVNVHGTDRCAYTDIQLYEATRILKELADRMTLSPVKVAVVDSGLELAFGQFDDVAVLNLADPNATPTDTNGHGTRVSGIIAADDGDGGTNGIATTVLGSRVALEAGGFTPDGFANVAAVTRAVFDGDADVVNMSYGARWTPAEAAQQAAMMSLYAAIAAGAPDTVFVTSAGNVNEELTTTNNSPAGLQMPNFLTVGGTKHCEPTERWIHSDPTYGSTWGPLIDTSAPAHDVPVLPYGPTWNPPVNNPGGDPVLKSGTSYASPMVAAAAAIMKSFDSTLSGAEIKEYLTTYTYMTDESLNWRRFILVMPVVQMLIDRGAPADVLDLIDSDDDIGVWDINGQILNRMCEGVDLTVSGRGTWTYLPDASVAAGFINDMGYGATFGFEEGEDATFFMTQEDGGFALDTPFLIPEPMAVGFAETDDELVTNGVSGEIVFERCAITDRNPLDQSPMMVQVAGYGSGGLQGYLGSNPISLTFDTRFNMPVIPYPGSQVLDILEQVCDGGLMQ